MSKSYKKRLVNHNRRWEAEKRIRERKRLQKYKKNMRNGLLCLSTNFGCGLLSFPFADYTIAPNIPTSLNAFSWSVTFLSAWFLYLEYAHGPVKEQKKEAKKELQEEQEKEELRLEIEYLKLEEEVNKELGL